MRPVHFAHFMILIAGLLPYLTVGLVKFTGKIDNSRPRESLEAQQGWLKRADWAHRNHFEALPFFAAGVLVAEISQAPQGWVNLLAGVFILARLAYTAAYLADRATLRSAIFALGLAATLGLFLLGL